MVLVRQVRRIKPTRRSVSGIYPFRGKSSIPYESTLERDFLIRTEFNRSVLDIIPQPVRIPFVGGSGRSYLYTPDFLVRFRGTDKPLLVEVKPAAEWRKHWREWSSKWKAARRYAKKQGWIFRIADEDRIRDRVLSNINALERYKRMYFAETDSQRLVDAVESAREISVDTLVASCFPAAKCNEGVSNVWHLVAMRRLACQMDSTLDGRSLLWKPSHD